MNRNKRIPSEMFWDIFAKELHYLWYSDEKRNIQRYSHNKKWTPYITKFLKNLSVKFGLNTVSLEFWPRLDIAYFSNEGDNWSEWSLEVAIEHESKYWPNWQDECNKLMSINAGLKVLITYHNDKETTIINQLKEFIKIYRSRKYHQPNDSWIFIFGPDQEIWEEVDFFAFKFDGKKLIKMPLKNILLSRD